MMDWLRAQNCESVFCRTVTQDDVGRVPEFKAAYDRGISLYGPRPDLALSWIISNMSQTFASGFYDSQMSHLAKLLGDQKPLQNMMTTTTVADGYFPGLAAGKYTVSNVIPIEVKGKGYVWTCEASVKTGLAAVNLTTSKVATCDLSIKDLPQCNTGTCGKT